MNNLKRRLMGDSEAITPLAVGQSLDFDYTGEVQSCKLAHGKYKLECWGAQGGHSPARSAYGMSVSYGARGGYAAGILDLHSSQKLYAFVGGAGSAEGNGGWNGGGGSIGFTANDNGQTSMACGGGGTDIATVSSDMEYDNYRNDRSQESLLSRFVVAGGGSGGTAISLTNDYKRTQLYYGSFNDAPGGTGQSYSQAVGTYYQKYKRIVLTYSELGLHSGSGYYLELRYLTISSNLSDVYRQVTIRKTNANGKNLGSVSMESNNNNFNDVLPFYTVSGTTADRVEIIIWYDYLENGHVIGDNITSIYLSLYEIDNNSSSFTAGVRAGYRGGGESGSGGTTEVCGKQNSAGTNGAFGKGANALSESVKWSPAAGGGGWYGGGSAAGNNDDDTRGTTMSKSGGGSGFVNISDNAQYRPTGYTGLELIAGVTIGSEKLFPSVTGDTENGHAGNGYARITRINWWDFDYTGAAQTLTVGAGKYKLECWGASGGTYNTVYPDAGSYGGYSVGELTLQEQTTLYIYVGGKGTTVNDEATLIDGGFNGGGASYSVAGVRSNGSGGGASDVRVGTDSLYARVIVAGGGGGYGVYSSNTYSGGNGGGETGGSGSQYNTSHKAGSGGTKNSAGSSCRGTTVNSATYGNLAGFGFGGGAKEGRTDQVAGGGGGWYGGGYAVQAGAGGGSGYVYTSSSARYYPTGCLLNESYYLDNASTVVSTANNTPSKTDTYGLAGTKEINKGYGFVRITQIT